MSAVVDRSHLKGVASAECDIKEESGADRKAEVRRELLINLFVDSRQDSEHYCKNYTVGRGAE